MLTKEDFHHNLQIINFGCNLGIIPLQFDSENKQIEVLTSKWKRVASSFYFALFTIHAAYVTSSLPYLLLTDVHLPLLSLLVHFTMMCGKMTILFWHFVAFFPHPDITATCFNKALEPWSCGREGRVNYFR